MWEHRSCRISTSSSFILQPYHKRKRHFLKSNPEPQAQQHFVSTCYTDTGFCRAPGPDSCADSISPTYNIMAYFEVQTDVLSMLQYQHRLYTSELAKSHGKLSQLYKKLERTERGLSEWQDRGLTRKDKKKLQWDRSTTKTSVRDAEANQALLHEYLRQSNDLIASYSPYFFQDSPVSWALSPTATSFAPDSAVPPTPWTAGPFEERTVWGNSSAPQYWDLSMLRERQSPDLAGSPDSGYYEPARRGVPSGIEGVNEIQPGSFMNNSSQPPVSSHRSSLSDQDLLPELVTPSSPARVGAEIVESSHKRRFSENAIQVIESRLMANKSRVCSVPPQKRVAY
jgi:hypothetical protein